jgi:DNA topoisomerase I
MFSDDEIQSAQGSALNGHVGTFTNGTSKVQEVSDDDDDMPLVCARSIILYTSLLTIMKSQTRRQEATSLPRTLKRKKPVYAESSSEDDTPLASSPMKSNGVKSNGKSIVKQGSSGTDAQNDEDVPNKRRISNGKPPRKKIKDDDDQPIMPAKSSAGRKRKARTKSETDSEAEVPIQKPPRRKKVKEDEDNSPETEAPKKRKRKPKGKTEEIEGASPTKAKSKKEEEEEEEEVFKWWENEADPNGDDGSVKWQTLEHNGVIFPPPYEPLPDNVKMKYKGMFCYGSSCPLLFTNL